MAVQGGMWDADRLAVRTLAAARTGTQETVSVPPVRSRAEQAAAVEEGSTWAVAGQMSWAAAGCIPWVLRRTAVGTVHTAADAVHPSCHSA